MKKSYRVNRAIIVVGVLIGLLLSISIAHAQDEVCTAVVPNCDDGRVVEPFFHGTEGPCFIQDQIYCTSEKYRDLIEIGALCQLAQAPIREQLMEKRATRCFERPEDKIRRCFRRLVKKEKARLSKIGCGSQVELK